jgi:hypothetical protein
MKVISVVAQFAPGSVKAQRNTSATTSPIDSRCETNNTPGLVYPVARKLPAKDTPTSNLLLSIAHLPGADIETARLSTGTIDL